MKTAPNIILARKRISTALTISVVTLASTTLLPHAHAASVLTVDLSSASSFAVLAGTGITIAAPADTVITGDIGTYSTTTITGTENLTLFGTNHGGDATTQAAKIDLQLAYTDAASRSADFSYGDGFNLTGTLTGGVHQSAGSFYINDTLTLDAAGDSSMVWIFQTTSTLDAASSSEIVLTNGALASNVFWQVGSSATLNTDSDFSGSILAAESITMNAGTHLNGRALALDGAVSMGSTIISIPEPSLPMLGSMALILWGFRHRRSDG